jgi:hypothetical protein
MIFWAGEIVVPHLPNISRGRPSGSAGWCRWSWQVRDKPPKQRVANKAHASCATRRCFPKSAFWAISCR